MTGSRIIDRNDAPVRADGEFVLYWMTSARRVRWNHALDRAVAWARELSKPVLVLEALRTDYPWASDRFHRIVLDGMRDNAAELDGTAIGFYPYVEPERGAGSGLLEALAERAAVVVTDEFPCFFLPRMVEKVAERLGVKLESVDSNGLLPLRAADRGFLRAYDFRRFLQRALPEHLMEFPNGSATVGDDLAPFGGVPASVRRRWPRATSAILDGSESLADLPIDHSVAPVSEAGGSVAARRALNRFLDERLERYGAERNHPDANAASELSGHLHFGHLSTHEILDAIARRSGWSPFEIRDVRSGRRSGWWNLDESTESFLDEVVTWRELCFNFAFHRTDYAELASLPVWARQSLMLHASDERPYLYRLEEFESAATHDEIWNAAQRELRERGRIHNYLRMLWGKKILHWSRSPEEALASMIELNNRYAIDGRDPNSYGGIFWVLGRFDRAWGPERPIFGKVRFMSSKNTRRKLRLAGYLGRWGANGSLAT